MTRWAIGVFWLLSMTACGSPWKLRGGVSECLAMCKAWDLDFSAMVGVGDQGRFSDGATACVCTLKNHGGPAAGAPTGAAAAAPAAAAVNVVQQQRQGQPGH